MSASQAITKGLCAAARQFQLSPRPRVRRPALVRQDSPAVTTV
ncbi:MULTISPECIES: hypothetical protein [Streptomyces]|nr:MULTISPECIES: hypothetical protein [unclassified Streptomyces]MCU4746752.1 hypothetical protein [Streptomyces sp. G-5]